MNSLKKREALGMIVAVLAVVILSTLPGLDRQDARNEKPAPTPIAQGEQTYSVWSGEGSGPKITKVVVNSFDPKRGERQTMIISVGAEPAVGAVKVALKTDNGEKTYEFEKAISSGLWGASWVVEDTHDYIYSARVEAISGKDTAKVDLSFR